MNKPERLTPRARAALRAQGLRPVEIWVPDLGRPEVRARIRREVEAIAKADREADDMAFIESISIFDELPPYEAPLRDEE